MIISGQQGHALYLLSCTKSSSGLVTSSRTRDTVTFHITDPTLSLSPPETLCRRIVDHQTLPVVCSLFPSGQFPSQPKSSGTLPYAKSHYPILRHFTCQWTPSNTCIITQHLGLRLHTEQIPYDSVSFATCI